MAEFVSLVSFLSFAGGALGFQISVRRVLDLSVDQDYFGEAEPCRGTTSAEPTFESSDGEPQGWLRSRAPFYS